MMKNILIVVLLFAVVLGGVYLIFKTNNNVVEVVNTELPVQQEVVNEDENTSDTDTSEVDTTRTVIGESRNGNDITAYHYGTGEREVLLVGGIHGGYSWNTTLLSYEMMEYFDANPSQIPNDVRLTIIPVLNPDGLEKVVGTTAEFAVADVLTSQEILVSGRFNGSNVDLNRNFDCDWRATGVWQSRNVSGGSAAFSEPESRAVRDYINSRNLDAVVVYYSAAGGVYASRCGGDILPQTQVLVQAYGEASAYPTYNDFTSYEVTGDMVNWLARQNIPAISVLLTNHTETEFAKNRAGVEAVINAVR